MSYRVSLLIPVALVALVLGAVAAEAPRIPARCPQFPLINGPGVLCEDFDTERNGIPGFQFTRLPILLSPVDLLLAIGDPNDDVLGYTQGTGVSPAGTGGRTCATGPDANIPTCTAPVAEENDWHLHSPTEGPGAGYDPPNRAGIGAPDGGKAHSGTRSMHWGRHTDPRTTQGDTSRFRQVSAFVLDSAVNLGPASTLAFWHIISVPDDENLGDGFFPDGYSFGGGQVQISLLGSNGLSEKWRVITPSLNGYDSTIQDTITICEFDPGDDEFPPDDNTMCDRSPMWADLGDVFGTDPTCTVDTDGNDWLHKDCGAITSCAGGPGCTERGSIGTGVWARSAFDLSSFAGREARLRWIGMEGGGWSFGISRSFLEPQGDCCLMYVYDSVDDGWWIDDVVLTDLREPPGYCAPDGDGDGVTVCDGDCDDTDPAINPLAVELPGNAVDENCDGVLACGPGAFYKNHGQFVRCVAQECGRLVAAGAVSQAQCQTLVFDAARSNIGKRPRRQPTPPLEP